MNKILKLVSSLMTIVALNACSTINAIVPPSTDLEFNVAKNVNPDFNGRPSPVVAKVFELSSRTIFDTQDFFTLYENPDKVLGPDLIKRDELELQPLEMKKYKMVLNKNTRYVGVIVAYRNIDGAKWRAVIEVDPRYYDDISVNIEKLAIYMKEKNNLI